MKSCAIACFFVATLFAGCVGSRVGEKLRGMWLTATKDPTNQAHADVVGRMLTALQEVWSVMSGDTVNFARVITIGDKKVLLAQVGTTPQLTRLNDESSQGRVLWEKMLSASIHYPSIVDGDGVDEIVVGTSVGPFVSSRKAEAC